MGDQSSTPLPSTVSVVLREWGALFLLAVAGRLDMLVRDLVILDSAVAAVQALVVGFRVLTDLVAASAASVMPLGVFTVGAFSASGAALVIRRGFTASEHAGCTIERCVGGV